MQVTNAYEQSCHVVIMDNNETYVRHGPDAWEWVNGMSTEVVTDPHQLEDVWQEWMLL